MPSRRLTQQQEGPTNADLKEDFQRQLDQLRADNTREHEAMRAKVDGFFDKFQTIFNSVEKLVATHDQALYGKDGEGGVLRQTEANNKEIVQTKLGGALAALTITIGIIAAKITRLL